MKKFFFFRSHSSNNSNNDQISSPSTDKPVFWEKPMGRADNSTKYKHVSDDQVFGNTACLRRTRSFSSGSLYDTGEAPGNNMDLTGSPCSASYYSNKQSGHRTSR